MKMLNITFLISFSLLFINFKPMERASLNKKLAKYIATLDDEFNQIPEERQAQLKELGAYLAEKLKAGGAAQVTVICTHNSRRSHIGQLWLRTAAIYYGLDNIAAFSGGTEATAFNPRAVAAMKRAGFKIRKTTKDKNPVYEAVLGANFPTLIMFSKKFSDRRNPEKGFAALMVCSEADAACPFVPGADGRFSIPYEDPKNFDGTPAEAQAYDERCRQIARELFFAVRHAKGLMASPVQ
jgi:hypothetical protein